MKKPILISFGLLCTGLAFLGVFLPVLPTTPLLLVALACFAKSSEKFHDWLLTHKTFGPPLRQWHETRSMTRKAKVIAIITILISGGISLYSVDRVLFRFLLLAVITIPVIVILKIKSTESLSVRIKTGFQKN